MSITFEKLQMVNSTIKKTPVKGKDYAEVNQRVKAFRMLCPNGSIMTDMLPAPEGMCIFKATVFDEEGHILATGTAYEKEGSTQINRTSFIENCETSAVGRALGMCGIGIDVSIASAEEVTQAIAQQGVTPVEEAKLRAELLKLINDNNLNVAAICNKYGVAKVTEMDYNQATSCVDWIKRKVGESNA